MIALYFADYNFYIFGEINYCSHILYLSVGGGGHWESWVLGGDNALFGLIGNANYWYRTQPGWTTRVIYWNSLNITLPNLVECGSGQTPGTYPGKLSSPNVNCE